MPKMNPEVASREKPLIIPIFIMNRGCAGRCVFCNEKIAAGNFTPNVTKSFFDHEVSSYLAWSKNKHQTVEIAFYGGSFTGLPLAHQEQFLDWAQAYRRMGKIQSIRISTRPDDIDANRLEYLKTRGVGAVELGAQSFNDEVLRLSGRGHDASATVYAMKLLKSYEFQTGLHLMAGLPGDTSESFMKSLDQTVLLHPDTVRIHPVLVFADTPLADQYHVGRYHPLSLQDAVSLCFLAWETLSPSGIRIIRFGLQITPEMNRDGAIVTGPIHPAFGSLVYSDIFLACTRKLLADLPRQIKELRFAVHQRDVSNFRGYKNKNMEAIKKLYPKAHIIVDSNNREFQGRIAVQCQTGETRTMNIPGIS